METPNGWVIDAVRLDQGHLRIPVPEKGSQAAVEIWDSKGRQFHQVEIRSSFETVIEDGQSVMDKFPSQVIPKDISNPKCHKALACQIQQYRHHMAPPPRRICAGHSGIWNNEMAQQVHDISSSNKGHRFQTPPTLNCKRRLRLSSPIHSIRRNGLIFDLSRRKPSKPMTVTQGRLSPLGRQPQSPK